jgi:hypothetical protein
MPIFWSGVTYDCRHISIETKLSIHRHGEFDEKNLVSAIKTIWEILASAIEQALDDPR